VLVVSLVEFQSQKSEVGRKKNMEEDVCSLESPGHNIARTLKQTLKQTRDQPRRPTAIESQERKIFVR
jgi:hypothetical protein